MSDTRKRKAELLDEFKIFKCFEVKYPLTTKLPEFVVRFCDRADGKRNVMFFNVTDGKYRRVPDSEGLENLEWYRSVSVNSLMHEWDETPIRTLTQPRSYLEAMPLTVFTELFIERVDSSTGGGDDGDETDDEETDDEEEGPWHSRMHLYRLRDSLDFADVCRDLGVDYFMNVLPENSLIILGHVDMQVLGLLTGFCWVDALGDRAMYIHFVCASPRKIDGRRVRGKDLLTEAIAHARRMGCKYVKLSSVPTAVNYYDHLGFKFRRSCRQGSLVRRVSKRLRRIESGSYNETKLARLHLRDAKDKQRLMVEKADEFVKSMYKRSSLSDILGGNEDTYDMILCLDSV